MQGRPAGGGADAGPLLRSLHWLPVRGSGHVQDGTDDLQAARCGPQRAAANSPARLCGHRVIVHRPETELARRAFSVAATCFSDSLPADTRLRNTAAIFKRHKDTSFHSKTIIQHRRYRLRISGLHGAIQIDGKIKHRMCRITEMT